MLVLAVSCTQLNPQLNPQLNSQLQRPSSQVEIIRDEWGVPHIYTDTEAAGFFGLGYAQAQDRLQKLLGLVLWARGEAGKTGISGVDVFDYHNQLWRHRIEGEAGWQRLQPQLQRNYRHFTAGVQAYMADFPEQVPPYAPALTAADWVMVNRALFWLGYQTEVGLSECAADGRQLELEPALAPWQSGAVAASASNGIAVSSKRSGGASLLLADPHTEVGANSAYYEAHINAGPLHVSGFVVGPMLWQVHNGKLAWTMTTGAPDVVDCYRVRLDEDKPGYFKHGDQWRAVRQDTALLYNGERHRKAPLQYIDINGLSAPVVARDQHHLYALATPYMHDAGAMDAEIYRMVKAQTVAELAAAMKANGMFPQNIIAADDRGGLFYVRAGKTPSRAPGYDWSKPVDGNDPAAVWNGIHRFDELLQLSNPPQGYLQNNNGAPDTMMEGEVLFSQQDTQAYLFNDQPGRITTRGLTSRRFLAQADSLTAQQLQRHAFDERWYGVRRWQRVLRSAAAAYRPQSWPREWLDSLLEFDGRAARESPAALRYYFWLNALPELLAAAGQHAFLNDPWNPQRLNEHSAAVLLQALHVARRELESALGESPRTLGDFARIGSAGSAQPIGGISILPEYFQRPGAAPCADRVNPFCPVTMRAFKLGAVLADGSRLVATGSQALRLVAFEADGVQAWSLYAHGQSLRPESAHASDQDRLFSDKRLKQAWWLRRDVEANARDKLLLDVAYPLTVEDY